MDELEQRKERITSSLSEHGVPYALIGGQAVIAWVSTIDPDATRTTKDVDLLLRREDLTRAKQAAATAGFEYYELMGIGMFLEKANQSPKRAVHIVWANEFVRPGEYLPAPPIENSVVLGQGISVVSLDGLLRMKLTAWRRHDQVHVDDLLKVGLIDASWVARLPAKLAARLQHLIDNPE
ncbi:MAG: hypothetical protein WD872_02585 [Pirellulaceae bacterium]